MFWRVMGIGWAVIVYDEHTRDGAKKAHAFPTGKRIRDTVPMKLNGDGHCLTKCYS